MMQLNSTVHSSWRSEQSLKPEVRDLMLQFESMKEFERRSCIQSRWTFGAELDIDLLIGSDHYWKLVTGRVVKRDDGSTAIET